MEKIWLKNYTKGVPAEINPDTYQSIVDMFEKSCMDFSEHPAFYSLGTTITYKQLDAYSRAFAAYLQQELKLKPGSRVALMLPNVLQYPVALYGILRAGYTVVNVNPLYTSPELIHQINDADAETIVVLANFANTVQKALPQTCLKNIIVTQVGDLLPQPKRSLINFVLKYIKRKVPAWHIPQAIQYRKVISAGENLSLERPAIKGQDIAFLQYTGGTTGIAKAAMLTHRNIVANVLQAEAWFTSLFQYGKEIIITALPLYHIFSLTANCLLITKTGGLNVLIINPRDLPSMIADMAKFKFTVFTGVNTLFNALLKHPKFTQLDFSAVKINLGGGMAVQRAVSEKWKAATGKHILEAYGLTEASPAVSINPFSLKEFNGSIGLPISSTQACILDDDAHEVPLGTPGELAIKGPQVMRGYWRHPIETEKVFTKEGWLLTGDIASMDEQGFIRILERKKDMIIVSGFNVYPNEIEDVLVSMPGVVEAAVIGVPDEHSGEVVKAFIVKDIPNLTMQDIKNFCSTNLTKYKIPRYVEFVSELPKTNVGKILRRALR